MQDVPREATDGDREACLHAIGAPQGTRRTTRALVAWAVLGTAVALATATVRGSTQADAQPERLSAGDAAVAQERYQVVCATCHGAAAQGGPVPGSDRTAPGLTGVPAAYVDLVIRTGRMPPPGDPFDNRERRVALDDEERELLVAWMTEEFELEPGIPVPGEGDVAEGFAAYQGNCAQCHGASGQGGVAGAGAWTPNIAQYEPVVILEAIRVGPFEMPAFSEDQISDEAADGIAAFLEEVEVERGTPILGLVELNPVTASAFVGVFALAVVLSLFFIAGRPTSFPGVAGAPRDPDPEATRMPQPSDDASPTPAPTPPPSTPRTYEEAGLAPAGRTDHDDDDVEQREDEDGLVTDTEQTGQSPSQDPEYAPTDAEGRPDPLATPGPARTAAEEQPEVPDDPPPAGA